MLTRPQIAALPDDALIIALADVQHAIDAAQRIRHVATRNRTIAEARACAEHVVNEIRSREYVRANGPYVTERMSPWSVEKRIEATWQKFIGRG